MRRVCCNRDIFHIHDYKIRSGVRSRDRRHVCAPVSCSGMIRILDSSEIVHVLMICRRYNNAKLSLQKLLLPLSSDRGDRDRPKWWTGGSELVTAVLVLGGWGGTSVT